MSLSNKRSIASRFCGPRARRGMVCGVVLGIAVGACGGPSPRPILTPDHGPGEYAVRNQSTCHMLLSSVRPRAGGSTPAQRLAEVPPGGSTVVRVPTGQQLHTLFVREPNAVTPAFGVDCRGTGPVSIERVERLAR